MAKKRSIDDPFSTLLEREGLLPTDAKDGKEGAKKATKKASTKKSAAKKKAAPKKPAPKKKTTKQSTVPLNDPLEGTQTPTPPAAVNEEALGSLQAEVSRVQEELGKVQKGLSDLSVWLEKRADSQLEPMALFQATLDRLEQHFDQEAYNQKVTDALALLLKQLEELDEAVQQQEVTSEQWEALQNQLTKIEEGVQEPLAETVTEPADLTPQLDALTAKLDAITAQLKELEAPGETQEVDLSALNEKLDALATQIAAIELPEQPAPVEAQEVDLSPLHQKLDELATQIATIEQPEFPDFPAPQEVPRVDLSPLQEQLEALSEQVASLAPSRALQNVQAEELDLQPLVEKLEALSQQIGDIALPEFPEFPEPQEAPEVDLSPLLDKMAQWEDRFATLEEALAERQQAPPLVEAAEVQVDTSALQSSVASELTKVSQSLTKQLEALSSQQQQAMAAQQLQMEQAISKLQAAPSVQTIDSFAGMEGLLVPSTLMDPDTEETSLTTRGHETTLAAVPVEESPILEARGIPSQVSLDLHALYKIDREALSRNLWLTMATVMLVVVVCGASLLLPNLAKAGNTFMLSIGHLGLIAVGMFFLRWLGRERIQIEQRIADHERHLRDQLEIATTMEPVPASLNLVLLGVMLLWWLILFSLRVGA